MVLIVKIKQEPNQSNLGTSSSQRHEATTGEGKCCIQGRFLTRRKGACRLEIDDGFRQRIVVSLALWCPKHILMRSSRMVEVGPIEDYRGGHMMVQAEVSVLA